MPLLEKAVFRTANDVSLTRVARTGAGRGAREFRCMPRPELHAAARMLSSRASMQEGAGEPVWPGPRTTCLALGRRQAAAQRQRTA